jgi:hypothetical protein
MQPFDTDVPFFANPDDTHCFQAALKMVIASFRPRLDCSWASLDRVTGKVDGVGTWPFAGYTWLYAQGLDVTNVEAMDNARFAAEGEAYLAELLGPELAAAGVRGIDIQRVQQQAAVFVDKVRQETRIPTMEDVCRAVVAGSLVICNVNSRVLNDRDGYMGHFVVVKGFDGDGLVVHDPGPPSTANRRIPFAVFEKAWAYPNAAVKNMVAISDSAHPSPSSPDGEGARQREST